MPKKEANEQAQKTVSKSQMAVFGLIAAVVVISVVVYAMSGDNPSSNATTNNNNKKGTHMQGEYEEEKLDEEEEEEQQDIAEGDSHRTGFKKINTDSVSIDEPIKTTNIDSVVPSAGLSIHSSGSTSTRSTHLMPVAEEDASESQAFENPPKEKDDLTDDIVVIDSQSGGSPTTREVTSVTEQTAEEEELSMDEPPVQLNDEVLSGVVEAGVSENSAAMAETSVSVSKEFEDSKEDSTSMPESLTPSVGVVDTEQSENPSESNTAASVDADSAVIDGPSTVTGNEDIKEQSTEDSASKVETEEEKSKRYDALRAKIKLLKQYTYSNGTVRLTVQRAQNLDKMDKDSDSDGFVTVEVHGKEVGRTTKIDNNANPEWNETMEFNVKDALEDHIHLTVKDWDRLTSNDTIGKVVLRPVDICKRNGIVSDHWFPIRGSKVDAKLQITAMYFEMQDTSK